MPPKRSASREREGHSNKEEKEEREEERRDEGKGEKKLRHEDAGKIVDISKLTFEQFRCKRAAILYVSLLLLYLLIVYFYTSTH